MFTVALIGADGAGKTTLARRLEAEFPLPIKYLYMGINIESSNVALPTSRLVQFLKGKFGGGHGSRGHPANGRAAEHTGKGWVRSAFRFLNRFSEEWYRQFLAWKFKRRGYVVVYDRHFAFDFELPEQKGHENFFDWLHRWCLAHLYPRPDLVLYLDAPAEVLFARKGEATIEYLTARRNAFLRQGESVRNFIRIDATKPLEQVHSAAFAEIRRFAESAAGAAERLPVAREG